MTRRNTNSKKTAARTARRAPKTPPVATLLAEVAEKAAELQDTDGAEADEVPATEEPQAVDPADLIAGWKNIQQLETDHTKRKRDLERRAGSLETERAALDTRKEELDDLDRRLKDERGELKARVEVLDQREDGIAERERDAANGFTQRREQFEADLAAEEERRRAALDKTIAQARSQWDETWAVNQQTNAEKHQDLLRRMDAVAERERELAEAKEAALAEQQAAADERRFAKEAAARREEAIEQAVGRRTSDMQIAREAAERRAQALESRLREMERRIAEDDKARDVLGGRSLAEIIGSLQALRDKNDDLRRELDSIPRQDLTRLQRLEDEVQTLREANEDQLRENSSLNAIVQRDSLAVAERESFAAHNAGLRVINKQLQEHVAELVRQQQGLLAADKEASQFPECSRMDVELDLVPELDMATPDLRELANLVQRRLRHHEQSLSYSAHDIRLMLGGLHMSKLHLFQGISGIGKTGLACGLAAALGSPESFAVIPVRAGWRDPQDLVGYYNSFDRMFYESEFTKALYRAQCPQFADRPFFIVLDEMNLSHPEQYFSDVLSALERGPEGRLELAKARVRNPPKLLLDGTHLLLPPNVWFIGTANHDETTVGFADKTYDRSFVLELPHEHPEVQCEAPEPALPMGFDTLQASFFTAYRDQRPAADRIKAYFAEEWKKRLAEELRIGWGNRLDEQIDRFAPVVVAAGGSVGEAADHLMATRILRMLRGRYDIHARTIEGLMEDLEAGWTDLDSEHGPVSTMALLRQEIATRGGG